MKLLKILFIIGFLSFCWQYNVEAQPSQLKIYYRNNETNLVLGKAPIFSVEIKCVDSNNNSIELKKDNIILLESEAIINRTFSINPVKQESERWYRLEWTSAINVVGITDYRLVINYNGDVAQIHIPQNPFQVPLITFLNSNKDRIYEVAFTGQTTEEPIQIYFQYRGEYPCSLDSITFTSPYFKQIWSGNSFDNTPPPKTLLPGNDYLLTIIYTRPSDRPFQREYMIFHYAGGLERRLELVTQTYDVPLVRSLELIYPKGGEHFAPCQDVLIQWKGQAVDHPIILSFSADNGNQWNPIDTVNGTEFSYLWHVPATITDNGIIKVSQTFHRNRTINLSYDSSFVATAAFNMQSSKVVTMYSNGRAIEWDLYSNNEPNIITDIYIDNNADYLDVKYINNEHFLILREKDNESSLVFCSTNAQTINKNIKLNDKFKAKKIIIDSLNKFIAAVPKDYSCKIQFLDIEGKFIKYYVDTNAPIVDAIYNQSNNMMYVVLMNNDVKVLSLGDFPNIKEIDTYKFSQYLNLISSLSISQDGRFLGLSLCSAGTLDVFEYPNENYIYDMNTQTLFRKLMCSEHTPIGSDFNPTGNICIFAHQGDAVTQPQLTFFDLTGKLGFDRTTYSDFYPRSLIGFSLAKNGNSLIEYSEGYENNCLIFNFSVPESIQNEEAFIIEKPLIEISDIQIKENLLIGSENEYEYRTVFCNKGVVDAVFDDYNFKYGEHFRLKNKNIPDTIKVGECKIIEFTAQPLDTGNIYDSLVFTSCGYNYEIPISVNARNRYLSYLQKNPIDLGEVCMWETNINKLALFKNLDTIPILVNRAETIPNDAIYVVDCPRDTLIQPGEIYEVNVWFTPNKLGEIKSKIIIYHSNQEHVVEVMDIQGICIGTDVSINHSKLYFMPETKERILKLTNLGNAQLFIDSVVISPSGTYNIKNPLPIFVNSQETVDVVIEYLGEEPQLANLKFVASPCIVAKSIELGMYTAMVDLEIPTVTADPRDMDVLVPINFKRSENVAYNDTCTFEADIEVNPRIFYPTAVESEFGEANIISNTIIENIDRRRIKIGIKGLFNKSNGVLAVIHGIAGLCETDRSDISILKESKSWSKTVTKKITNGSIQLINLCDDRRIIRDNKLIVDNIFPNPAKDNINLSYNILSPINSDIKLDIYDVYGNNVISKNIINTGLGKGGLNILIDNLSAGTYNLHIKYEDTIQLYNFTIIR